MNSVNDTRLQLVGPIVLMFFGTFFFRLDIYFNVSGMELFLFNVVALAAGYLCWNLSRWTILAIQRRYPGLPQVQKRLLFYALTFPMLVNFAVFLRIEVHALRHSLGLVMPDLVDYATTTGIQVFYHCIYFGLYEGLYVLRQWRQTYQEKEALVKIQWQTRFDSLKAQVNPHFLFNSLNTISSLIDESPRLASDFVDELASVYRYLLRSNEGELTPLRTELEFIRSYFHLLKTRYGAGISLTVEVPDETQGALILPLALQLLVENALKYNRILPEEPLHIRIRVQPDRELPIDRLWVENSLQRKILRVDPDREGLTNMGVRYRLLGQPEPIIDERGGWFSVALPLIRGKVGETAALSS